MSGHGAPRQSFYFQFITTPSCDTRGTSLYLHFNNKRYLFGQMTEGTQRACIERSAGLKNVRNIFLTGEMSWNNHGGLIGMILTMSDTHSQSGHRATEGTLPPLHIHGAPGLMHTLACARRFVFRTGMPLSTQETFPGDPCISTKPTWSDENIRVWAIPVLPESQSKSLFSEESGSDNEADSSGEPECDKITPNLSEIANPTLDEPATPSIAGPELTSSEAEQINPSTEDNQKVRKSIVSDMFNSNWHRDSLLEVLFGEVKFPATIFIRDPKTKELHALRAESAESFPHINPSTVVSIRTPWPASLVGSLPPANDLPSQVALSYIVQGHPQRGKFNTPAAIKLGVKPGPAFAVLANGHSVELADGSVVTPEMVLGPTKPGRGIAIVDIPTEFYIKSVLSRPEWKDTQLMEGIESMIWFLPVLKTSLIDQFIKSLPRNIQHIVVPRERFGARDYLAFESSASSAIRLSRIWKDVFPVPDHSPTAGDPSERNIEILAAAEPALNLPKETLYAERGMRIQVEPTFDIQRAGVPPILPRTALEESALKEVPRRVYDLADAAREEISKISDGIVPTSEPQIITLGTGSAAPSKYRNVSSTLLRVPGRGSYLFDCGENTLGQLLRIFGPDIGEVLRDLRMIWISHLHADHHLGTVSILTSLNSLKRRTGISPVSVQPFFVVGEENMIGFLRDYNSLKDLGDFQGIVASPAGMTLDGLPFTFEGTSVPIKQLQSCNVSHCWGAQAVSVTFENGFKFSYSGDCRPSEKFAKIGAQSDVLVHEATFDDGLEGDAMAKKHCTTGEALAVAAKMGAKNVILTHFSQRYQKIPVMNDVKLPEMVRFEEGDNSNSDATAPIDEALDGVQTEDPADYSNAADTAFLDALIAQNLKPEDLPSLDMNVCVAFDYMSIRVSQIKQMQKFVPALEALFEVEYGPAEKTMSKAQKAGWTVSRQVQARPAEKTTNELEQLNGEAGEEIRPNKKQRRREHGILRHEQNMKNGGKREQSARADGSPDKREGKKMRSDEVAVPPELLANGVVGNEGMTKDAVG